MTPVDVAALGSQCLIASHPVQSQVLYCFLMHILDVFEDIGLWICEHILSDLV